MHESSLGLFYFTYKQAVNFEIARFFACDFRMIILDVISKEPLSNDLSS